MVSVLYSPAGVDKRVHSTSSYHCRQCDAKIAMA